MEDPRKTGLKKGLRQLNRAQLLRVLNYEGEFVLDSVNYEDGKFCPLAVAVGLDSMESPTDNKVFDTLVFKMGLSVFNTRGVKGEFYTTERRRDLLIAVREVLAGE